MAQPESFHQSELNDLVRDLCLPKRPVQLLSSRLSKKQVLRLGTNVSIYRHKDKEFKGYFQADSVFLTCIDFRKFLSE